MNPKASVVSIHIAPTGRAPMQSVAGAEALVGRGLKGDRYAARLGTYSGHHGSGRDVTLIEIEAIEVLERDYRIELDAGQARRNIVTRGVALNHLVNREFEVGEVLLRGARLCEPCVHMENLTVKGAMRGLIHRGGLRAEVIRGGIIRVADPIGVTIERDRSCH